MLCTDTTPRSTRQSATHQAQATLPRRCNSFRVPDDDDLARLTARYRPPEITPAQFERFVVDLLEAVGPSFHDFEVNLHDTLDGVDGAYDFDATVRFGLGGMQFLVLVEAKQHKNPIKRELVQVLHDKLRSVGAHKAAMISTAPYQRGALEYAKAHGIALATITEGRFAYETRSVADAPTMTREQAATRLGLPHFIGHAYQAAIAPDRRGCCSSTPATRVGRRRTPRRGAVRRG
jgi:hypothetical protein